MNTGAQKSLRNAALAVILGFAMTGCAAIDISHQYELAHNKPITVTTVVEGSTKSWNVYAHPTDLTRILVAEGTATSYAKALNPIGAFADLTAASDSFDKAVEAYLRLSERSCEIARSNEIPDMFAYEYRLRCSGARGPPRRPVALMPPTRRRQASCEALLEKTGISTPRASRDHQAPECA